MATLTKYNTFKSLKQNSSVKFKEAANSSVKVKKAANHEKIEEAEMEAFLQLLSKIKAKKA